MISARTAKLCICIASLTLVVTGCGSSKKDPSASFNKDYAVQSKLVSAIGNDIGTAIEGADKMTDAQVTTTFGGLAKRAHAAAIAIAKLTPPDKLALDKDTLSSAIEKGAADLDAIVTAAKAGDVEGAKEASTALVTDSAPIKAAKDKLDALIK